MKAFAEKSADRYNGFLVRGGGAAASRQFPVGEGEVAYAIVFVCARRPDGAFYAITKTNEGTYNFDAWHDRIFAVKLIWTDACMPQGYEWGSPNVGFFSSEPFETFQARFHGEYDETTIFQSGQSDRKEKVPVLVWERP
ncbi:MAG: hypothetical protein A2W31_14910 [Planctomycetes bacterium RBG_16_64_10]|nr:MAG: hypothetical protein A2W31_14910 [Planctomycetes bacterium RBG_16_64_10]